MYEQQASIAYETYGGFINVDIVHLPTTKQEEPSLSRKLLWKDGQLEINSQLSSQENMS